MIGADAFLQTILDQPDADGPRLVFADWLEEHGDCAHAELIRVQCELARLPDASPRKQELHVRQRHLLAGNDGEWGAVIRELGLSHRFRRGFMEVTVSGVRTLLETADALL